MENLTLTSGASSEPRSAPQIFEFLSQQDVVLAQLLRLRERLVLELEDISMELEHRMEPGAIAMLEGTELSKARHAYLMHATKVESAMNKLASVVEAFRVRTV